MTGLGDLEAALGYRFGDAACLDEALRHRSWVSETGRGPSNERLEFLGDTILQLVVTDFIFREYPGLSEGQLAKLRASVVNKEVLHRMATGLDLGRYLTLDRGEEATGGRSKPSILADAMEAVIGAVYLDGGLDAARRLVMRIWERCIRTEAEAPGRSDYKSRLNVELGSSAHDVRYTVTGSGPEHEKLFTATVFLGEDELGTGSGRSKREAEQSAARRALDMLGRSAAGSG